MFNKKYKAIIAEKEQEISHLKDRISTLIENVREKDDELVEYNKMFPIVLDQVVYELQLRSKTGRFTKTKPSKEHSAIVEVVVDKKNYFNIVEKLENNTVFTCEKFAQDYLDSVCIE